MASYLLTGSFLVLDLLLQGTFAALGVVPLATHLLRDLLELLLQRRALWGEATWMVCHQLGDQTLCKPHLQYHLNVIIEKRVAIPWPETAGVCL